MKKKELQALLDEKGVELHTALETIAVLEERIQNQNEIKIALVETFVIVHEALQAIEEMEKELVAKDEVIEAQNEIISVLSQSVLSHIVIELNIEASKGDPLHGF